MTEQRQLDFEYVKHVLRSHATSSEITQVMTGYFQKYMPVEILAKPKVIEDKPLTEADIMSLLNSSPKVV